MAIDWMREKHSRFIKICGITTVEDAAVCADLDVDAIGILLERPGKSPKAGSARLPVELAAAISSSIRGKCQVFTLIHTERLDLLDNYARIIQPDVMQMCLDISSPTLMQFREKWPEIGIIHSLKVAPETTTTELKSRIDRLISDKILDGVILDSAKGGSGQPHDWTVSAQIVEAFPELPMLLAGGLNADNVASALEVVKCTGVDVMTSVNSQNGPRKDKDRIARLVSAVMEEGH